MSWNPSGGLARPVVLTIGLMLGWLTVAFFGAFAGWWMSPVVQEEDTDGFYAYAVRTLQARSKGSSALVLISDGKVVQRYHGSPAGEVDDDTVFPAASMSKWIAACAMMVLVEEGQADLDAPVSQYLRRWQLPPSEFDNQAVTIRRLLSHTAGLGDDLGFGEYTLQEQLPSLVDELNHPRASSGDPTSIAVSTEPGREWRYSGGSYLLLELLIEEVSGRTYERFVQDTVFDPLGMTSAGYDNLDSYANNAGLFQLDGTKAASPRYASSAATGLVISSADLTRFVVSLISGEAPRRILPRAAIKAMRAPHGRLFGADIWGLGTMLYAPTGRGDFIFGHDGANDPAINSSARINPDTGDAMIVLSSGDPSVATRIGSEWVLWQTGTPDVLATDAVLASMVVPAAAGCGLIGLLGVVLHRRLGQRGQHRAD